MLTQFSVLESKIHGCSESLCKVLNGNQSPPPIHYRHIYCQKHILGIPSYCNSSFPNSAPTSSLATDAYVEQQQCYNVMSIAFTGPSGGFYNFSEALTEGGFNDNTIVTTGKPLYFLMDGTYTGHDDSWNTSDDGFVRYSATGLSGSFSVGGGVTWSYDGGLSSNTDNAGPFAEMVSRFMSIDFNTSQSTSNRDFSSNLPQLTFDCWQDQLLLDPINSFNTSSYHWQNYSGSNMVTLFPSYMWTNMHPIAANPASIACICGWGTLVLPATPV